MQRLIEAILVLCVVVPLSVAHAQGDSAIVVEAEPPPAWPEQLQDWYDRIGSVRPGEPFGELVVRAARSQVGKLYVLPPQTADPEALSVDLSGFECVSLVEASLAVARCTYVETPDQSCFTSELQAFRYRGGVIEGYASRLHYFSDWLDDNAARGSLELLTLALGGDRVPFTFDYMSKRAHRYPALTDPDVAEEIVAVEQRLSATQRVMIDREAVAPIHGQLQSGDVVAVVGNWPGLFIRHVGLVDVGPDGLPHLLHASSLLKVVTVTRGSVGSYITWNDKRRGVVIARPLPPQPAGGVVAPD